MTDEEFKKYSSIKNAKDIAAKMIQEDQGGTYVVEEKIHGANFSFITDGDDVCACNRTVVLEDNSDFFYFQGVYDRLKHKVQNLFRGLKDSDPELLRIQVYGELFGGYMDHPDYPTPPYMSPIQIGVSYTNVIEFLAFDIMKVYDNKRVYISVSERNLLCDAYDIPRTRPLFRGSLYKCMAYPNDLPSTISLRYGLPQIEGNIMEGIVIRLDSERVLRTGQRFIMKSKNDKFKEYCNRNKGPKIEQSIFEQMNEMVDELVNENRVASAISKVGTKVGLVMPEIVQDVFRDLTIPESFTESEIVYLHKLISRKAFVAFDSHMKLREKH